MPLFQHKPGSIPVPFRVPLQTLHHTELQNRLPNPSAGFINHDKAVELVVAYITFQAIYINICKLCGGASWWCCPADEMLQKNSGPQDVQVSAIISELGSLFLRAFIIAVLLQCRVFRGC